MPSPIPKSLDFVTLPRPRAFPCVRIADRCEECISGLYISQPPRKDNDYEFARALQTTNHIKPDTFVAAVGDMCIKVGRIGASYRPLPVIVSPSGTPHLAKEAANVNPNPGTVMLQNMRYARSHSATLCSNTSVALYKHTVCLFTPDDALSTVTLNALMAKMFTLSEIFTSPMASLISFTGKHLSWAEPVPSPLPKSAPLGVLNLAATIPTTTRIPSGPSFFSRLFTPRRKHRKKRAEKKATDKKVKSKINTELAPGTGTGTGTEAEAEAEADTETETEAKKREESNEDNTPSILDSEADEALSGSDSDSSSDIEFDVDTAFVSPTSYKTVRVESLYSKMGTMVSVYNFPGHAVSHVLSLRPTKSPSRAILSGTTLVSVVRGGWIHVHRTIPLHSMHLVRTTPDITPREALRTGYEFIREADIRAEILRREANTIDPATGMAPNPSSQQPDRLLPSHTETLCWLRSDVELLGKLQALTKAQRKYKFQAHKNGIIIGLVAEREGDFIATLATDRKIKIWIKGTCVCKLVNIPGQFSLRYPVSLKRVGQQLFYVASDGIFAVTIPVKVTDTDTLGRPCHRDDEALVKAYFQA